VGNNGEGSTDNWVKDDWARRGYWFEDDWATAYEQFPAHHVGQQCVQDFADVFTATNCNQRFENFAKVVLH